MVEKSLVANGVPIWGSWISIGTEIAFKKFYGTLPKQPSCVSRADHGIETPQYSG